MDERRRQSVTVSAKTVDEAIAAAERELGVPRDRLDITVITEGSRGFLGMRAENARILAMVVGGAPAAPPPAAPAQRPVHEGADVAGGPVGVAAEEEGEFVAAQEYADEEGEEEPEEGEEELEEGEEEPAEPGVRAEQRQETARIAQDILETLLRQMDLRARVSIRTIGNPIVLDVETENGGLLIGRHGDTLGALQYIVNVLVGKRTRRWTKVVVDVERWRERREETLRALALRQAERVRQQRRPIALDPMPANERRIIHLALQGHRDVDTHSEGEEPNRRLIITPKR
jgi:spoIIIJ-associated protein